MKVDGKSMKRTPNKTTMHARIKFLENRLEEVTQERDALRAKTTCPHKLWHKASCCMDCGISESDANERS